ncbi:hypothetical protein VTK26DRAFT_3759 [Humicola hyalothermophila]
MTMRTQSGCLLFRHRASDDGPWQGPTKCLSDREWNFRTRCDVDLACGLVWTAGCGKWAGGLSPRIDSEMVQRWDGFTSSKDKAGRIPEIFGSPGGLAYPVRPRLSLRRRDQTLLGGCRATLVPKDQRKGSTTHEKWGEAAGNGLELLSAATLGAGAPTLVVLVKLKKGAEGSQNGPTGPEDQGGSPTASMYSANAPAARPPGPHLLTRMVRLSASHQFWVLGLANLISELVLLFAFDEMDLSTFAGKAALAMGRERRPRSDMHVNRAEHRKQILDGICKPMCAPQNVSTTWLGNLQGHWRCPTRRLNPSLAPCARISGRRCIHPSVPHPWLDRLQLGMLRGAKSQLTDSTRFESVSRDLRCHGMSCTVSTNTYHQSQLTQIRYQ